MSTIEQRAAACKRLQFNPRRLQRIPLVFSSWQPRYAAHGIATFPLCAGDRQPAIRNYGRIGLRQSTRFATHPRFAEASGFAFMCGRRSGLTIGDIDTDDENMVADLLDRHGHSPVIARTASGHFHAYYRFNNEPRKIRCYGEAIPFDLLGGGMAIAPPSQLNAGGYQFIQGNLDDLDQLRPINIDLTKLDVPDGVYDHNEDGYEQELPAWIRTGHRNKEIFNHCMRRAHYCGNLPALIAEAQVFYQKHCESRPAMDSDEIMHIAKNAWNYTERGLNRFGQHSFIAPTLEYEGMVLNDGDAFLLLAYLKMQNGPSARFMISNTLAEAFKWDRKRLANARKRLLGLDIIEQTRAATSHYGPALYRWLR
jgi:hypothetical protein